MTININGESDDRFESVRNAFEPNFEDLGEVGAALCVYHNGRPVVDLWGGFRDAAKTEPWEQDTLACVYSVSKGITLRTWRGVTRAEYGQDNFSLFKPQLGYIYQDGILDCYFFGRDVICRSYSSLKVKI